MLLPLFPVRGPVGAAGLGIYSVFERVMISGLQKGLQYSTRKRATKVHSNRLRVCQRGPRGGALAKCGPLISNVWRTDCTKGNQYNKPHLSLSYVLNFSKYVTMILLHDLAQKLQTWKTSPPEGVILGACLAFFENLRALFQYCSTPIDSASSGQFLRRIGDFFIKFY